MITQDIPKAKSLLSAATRDMSFTLTLPVSQQSGATLIRNIYESFRMLGEALLALAGIKSSDHNTQLNELFRRNIRTKRPLRELETIKSIRHKINYDGYEPTIPQTENAVGFAKTCFDTCKEAVESEIASA